MHFSIVYDNKKKIENRKSLAGGPSRFNLLIFMNQIFRARSEKKILFFRDTVIHMHFALPLLY